MKFLCDRCKTRYSIADERVRGKVLKIRCKSCSHVITVREGMTDEEVDAPAAAPAKGKAPAGNGSALADAFAQVMQPRPGAEPPPPALEEEWYVSLDGDQQGPFSLSEAQAWVSARKHDDELFCWSEGFDDWLPVDKISHFRGLRTKPAAAARPKPPSKAAAREPEVKDPQPLFAATLAALEAEIESADKPTTKAKAKEPAKAKESKAKESAKAKEPAKAKESGSPGKTNGKGAAASAAPTAAASAALASLSPAGGSSGPSRTAKRFDLGEDSEGPDADAPELEDDDADLDGGNDDLEIGEVSRVVRLPDLMAAHQKATAARAATSRTGSAAAIRPSTAAVARGTGGVAALTATATLPPGAAATVDGVLPPGDATGEAAAPAPAPAHKHTTLYLVAAAVGVLFIGIVTALIVSARSDDAPVAFGDTSRYDSLGRRIDDPRRPGQPAKADDPAKGGGRTGARTPPRTGTAGGGAAPGVATGKTETIIGPDGLPITPLTVDDVLQVSSRMSSGTRRCYERALKEDPFLKVTKIIVDLTVEDSGVVSSVTLDSNQNNTLGKCLTAAIRRWPFRKSTKRESFRFPLVFEQR
jgi:predicted Zn finger-like uncharacterized protein